MMEGRGLAIDSLSSAWLPLNSAAQTAAGAAALSAVTSDDPSRQEYYQQTSSPKPYFSRHLERELGGSNDNNGDSSYLVDENGNQYEPYSLAWRYLGVFIDCEDEEDDNNDDDQRQEEDEQERTRRTTQRRRSLSSDDNSNGSGCARKVLWAAYHDPRYSGGTIGEYQYYNFTTGQYNEEYCRTERCAKMDCHERDTHFELVGVFKETDGFYDFAEQLFKHEGYCIWDYDTYSLMSTYREYMPSGCQQLYFPDDDGNTIYMDIQPQPKGDISLGVYTTADCRSKKSKMTIQQYIEMFYNIRGDDEGNNGAKVARAWKKAIKRWNKHMNVYKVCQPCRAHFLPAGLDYEEDEESGSADNNNNRERRHQRRLDDNDGDGEEEQWGYDCYDDAGYLNCNQCYKFETKTYMEPATIDDLKAATKQGSMLEIHVNGKRYGKGGYYKPFLATLPLWAVISGGGTVGIVVIGLFTLAWKKWCSNSKMLGTFFQWIRDRWNRKDLPNPFKEHFHIEDDKTKITVDFQDDDGYYDGKPLSYIYE